MNNTPYQLLLYGRPGLTDIIGTLLINYYTLEETSQVYNIDIHTPIYTDLKKYFTFNEKIKVVRNRHSDYNDRKKCAGNGSAVRNYTTEQIRQVVKISNKYEYIDSTLSDYIAVHFRHHQLEKRGVTTELQKFKESFLKIYSVEKKYLIVSDCADWLYEFTDKDNIKLCIPIKSINANVVQNDFNLRNEHLPFSIQQLCNMASCKEIITTWGCFPYLTKLLTDKVRFSTLSD
jgi:hypothetical protein